MPTRGLINPELLTGIADAIRAKNGTSAKMTPAQMAAAVEGLVVTPEGIVTATGQMTTEQAAQTRENLKLNAYVTPEMFPGTNDQERLGSAINSLTNGGVIVINRTYTLTGNVVISRASSGKMIVIMALNPGVSINCGDYGFTGTVKGNTGNICFVSVNFSGNEKLIDGYYLVKIKFSGCSFHGFDNIVYSSGVGQEKTNIVDVKFDNCVIRHISDYIIKLSDASSYLDYVIGVSFSHCLIEWCESGIVFSALYSNFCFTNNTAEGFTGGQTLFGPIKVANSFVVKGNFFEANECTYINMGTNAHNVINAEITDNIISENNASNINLIVAPKVNTNGQIFIARNSLIADQNSNIFLVYVDDATSETLSCISMEGNTSTTGDIKHDTNSRITTTTSFARINENINIIERVSTVVDQSAGKTVSISVPVFGYALNGSTVGIPVALPFTLKDTEHITISLSRVDLVNLGNITAKSSVYSTIRNGGFEVRATNLTVTSGSGYTGYVSMLITFA